MKIKCALNGKSIKQVVKQLNEIKKQIPLMLDEFYYTCYLRFVEYSRSYLNLSDIGENVKSDIYLGWQYERTVNGARFSNYDDKAVFVEFGVGQIGQELSHINAKRLGNSYQYNIGTKIKSDGSWIFNVSDDNDIDIQSNFIENRTANTVRTKGSPAIMYAYNALVDLQIDIPKIWQEIKIKYLG